MYIWHLLEAPFKYANPANRSLINRSKELGEI